MNSREGQALVNGQVYMEKSRTILLGLSVGNPHYFRMETLERLFQMTEMSSGKVTRVNIGVSCRVNRNFVLRAYARD